MSIPMSKSRRIGDTIYLSGELGFDENGTIPEGIEAQTKNCLANIQKTLAGEGLELSNIISASCLLTDASDFAAFNTVYGATLPTPYPVRTTAVTQLVIEAKLEITVIAQA